MILTLALVAVNNQLWNGRSAGGPIVASLRQGLYRIASLEVGSGDNSANGGKIIDVGCLYYSQRR